MNNQRVLERHLIEELRRKKVLEDIFSEYDIEDVRICGYCGKLMNEGWMYGGFETFCSTKCMMSAHPDEDLEDIKRHACNNGSDTYWTAWEG